MHSYFNINSSIWLCTYGYADLTKDTEREREILKGDMYVGLLYMNDPCLSK